MKTICTSHDVKVPENVTVTAKARVVTVKGPRGTLTRNFRFAHVDINVVNGTVVRVDKWFGNRKTIAGVKSVAGHISNMITGVTKGFQYKMRLVYAHFPININIDQGGKILEIRNFMGEKVVRRVPMLDGVTVSKTDVKDELAFEGNDVENVSGSCALVHQKCLVKKKDIRKFLDGIYVSFKGNVQAN